MLLRLLLQLNFRPIVARLGSHVGSRFWQVPGQALLRGLAVSLAAMAPMVSAAQTGGSVDSGSAGMVNPGNGAAASKTSDYSYSKGLQLVQRVDNVLFGVDPISLAPLGNRHVSGVLVRVNTSQPSPVLGYSHFVADCRKPLRMTIVATAQSPLDLSPQGSSARARYGAATAALDSGVFTKAHMLDGSWSVAEFACDSTQRPSRTAQIARELFERGGPGDMRTALCDLQTDGDLHTRQDVEVRFSDSEKVVVVNKQWLSSGRVTDTEISFGSGTARWRIDRAAAEASLVHPDGKVMFVGSCVARDAKP